MELSKSDFIITPKDNLSSGEVIARPNLTYWQDARRRFRQNKMAMVGFWILVVLILAAIFGPYLSPHTYFEQDYTARNSPPSMAHWFGTDALGRDLFVRTLYGARISLAVGIFASITNLLIGVVYGGIAGYFGGMVDNIMMRIIDIMYAVPLTLFIILLMVVFEPGLVNIFIAIGVVYWLDMARIVRGQILSLKERDFVLAARVLGVSKFRILFRHLIPNAMGPIIVTATMGIPLAIFTEAFLSFIGLGVSAPMASWGMLASSGKENLMSNPYQLIFPAAAICVTMLAFNFVGDGLQDALDPRQRK
jgi:oligopeptide transport system permease protein